MRSLIAIIAFVLLTSCGGQKRPVVTTVNTIDSTEVEKTVRFRDTLIAIPSYKVDVAVPVNELTSQPVTRQNERAKIELFKKDDVVYATASCDSLELQLKLRDSIIKSLRTVRTDTKVTLPPERIKYVPWIVKALAWIGALFLLFVVGRVVMKFYNPFSR